MTQPVLFDDGTPSLDTSFASARRISLDDTSWVEHVPGWMSGAAVLFDELMADAAFEQRTRHLFNEDFLEPRLTAEYDDVAKAPPLIREVAAALEEHYGRRYRTLWINLYRDHRDGTGWHGDLIGKREAESVVPVLSLGASRRFLIRPKDGGESVKLSPAGGDLIVMGGRAQRDWRHCVPKQTDEAGPRISINFAPS